MYGACGTWLDSRGHGPIRATSGAEPAFAGRPRPRVRHQYPVRLLGSSIRKSASASAAESPRGREHGCHHEVRTAALGGRWGANANGERVGVSVGRTEQGCSKGASSRGEREAGRQGRSLRGKLPRGAQESSAPRQPFLTDFGPRGAVRIPIPHGLPQHVRHLLQSAAHRAFATGHTPDWSEVKKPTGRAKPPTGSSSGTAATTFSATHQSEELVASNSRHDDQRDGCGPKRTQRCPRHSSETTSLISFPRVPPRLST